MPYWQEGGYTTFDSLNSGNACLHDSIQGSVTQRRRPQEADIRIRSEVEAPFRAVRFVLFGFFVVSASVGALIATTQVIAALNNAPQVIHHTLSHHAAGEVQVQFVSHHGSLVHRPTAHQAGGDLPHGKLPAVAVLEQAQGQGCFPCPQALPLEDVATSLAIDLGAAALFGFLLRNDLQVCLSPVRCAKLAVVHSLGNSGALPGS